MPVIVAAVAVPAVAVAVAVAVYVHRRSDGDCCGSGKKSRSGLVCNPFLL